MKSLGAIVEMYGNVLNVWVEQSCFALLQTYLPLLVSLCSFTGILWTQKTSARLLFLVSALRSLHFIRQSVVFTLHPRGDPLLILVKQQVD